MRTITVALPAMYGDHHVIAVRRLLHELPGVAEVYASSSFHVVEVSYDEQLIGEEEIQAALDAAGYGGELPVPVERGAGRSDGRFRHTAAFAEVGRTVTFTQNVAPVQRALWPCPGVGPVTAIKEENDGPAS